MMISRSRNRIKGGGRKERRSKKVKIEGDNEQKKLRNREWRED